MGDQKPSHRRTESAGRHHPRCPDSRQPGAFTVSGHGIVGRRYTVTPTKSDVCHGRPGRSVDPVRLNRYTCIDVIDGRIRVSPGRRLREPSHRPGTADSRPTRVNGRRRTGLTGCRSDPTGAGRMVRPSQRGVPFRRVLRSIRPARSVDGGSPERSVVENTRPCGNGRRRTRKARASITRKRTERGDDRRETERFARRCADAAVQ